MELGSAFEDVRVERRCEEEGEGSESFDAAPELLACEDLGFRERVEVEPGPLTSPASPSVDPDSACSSEAFDAVSAELPSASVTGSAESLADSLVL